MNKDYKNAQEIGITQKDRYADKHRPMSERLVNFLADHDSHDYDNYFRWTHAVERTEMLMAETDAFFEYLDHTKETKETIKTPNINELKQLIAEASSETMHISSCHQMLKTNSVKKILAAGELAIPFILQHYKQQRIILWGIVLDHITDINLIEEGYFKEKHRGRVDKLQKSWLKWGKNNGYILS